MACLIITGDFVFFFLDSDMASRPESMGCGRNVVQRVNSPSEAGIDSKEFKQLGPGYGDKIVAAKV